LAVSLLVPASPAFAQQIRFGILGGLSLATIEFDPDPGDFEFGRREGPAAGVSLEFGLNDHFAIEPRALWVRKGAELTDSDFGALDSSIQIDYVSVPVFFKLRGGGAIRPYIAVGPEVGFKLNAKTVFRAEGQEEEEDFSDEVRSTDFAIAGAAGLEFAVGRVGVFVEGGYSYSLTSIEKEDEVVDAIDTNNRAILVLAGIRF
jgi:opacity protein-like surface antigen